MRIWISKPFYESLPFIYILAGVGLLVGSLYLNYWYWPTVCLVAGVICLIFGLFVLLRRRDFRSGSKRDKNKANKKKRS